MKTLKVESNVRLSASNPTAIFGDGYAVFWHVSWPKKEPWKHLWEGQDFSC